MKNLNKILFASIGLIFLISGCVKPDIIERNDETGIANIWVEIPGLKERFNGYFNAAGDTAYVDMSYFYPAESDNEVDLSNLILRTNVSVDASVAPALGVPMDLSNPLPLTITSGTGDTRTVNVVVRKLGDLSVKSLSITIDDAGNTQEVTAIPNGNEFLFFVLPGIDLSNVKLNVTVSRHSQTSISSGDEIDLSSPVSFTVTGIDGRSQTYTFRALEPQKLDYGIGISKLLFSRSNAQLTGFTTSDNNRAMAVSGDYFILSVSTTPSVYKVYNRFTGEYVKDLTPPPGGIRSFAIANDSKGRIILSSWAPKNAAFIVYVYENVDDESPQLLFNWTNNNPTGITGDGGVGRRMNVYGDLSGDAVITATAAQSNVFYKWRVEGGNLVSATPEPVVYNSILNNIWAFYVEAQPISAAADGDYFVNYPLEIALVNGATNNRISAFSNDAAVVGINHNATDYIEFNNAKYLLSGTFTSLTTRMVLDVFDVSDPNRFSLIPASAEFSKFRVFRSPAELTANSNGNGAGDVVGVVSDDGELLHVYVLLTNGGVMAYEFTTYSPQN